MKTVLYDEAKEEFIGGFHMRTLKRFEFLHGKYGGNVIMFFMGIYHIILILA